MKSIIKFFWILVFSWSSVSCQSEEEKIEEWLETSLVKYLDPDIDRNNKSILEREIFTEQYLEYKKDANEVYQPYVDFQSPDDMTEEEFRKKWQGIFNIYNVHWQSPLSYAQDIEYDNVEQLKEGLFITFKEKKGDVYCYYFECFTPTVVIKIKKHGNSYKVIDVLEHYIYGRN